MKLKDDALVDITKHGGNVAQFVSFDPAGGMRRHARIRHTEPTRNWASTEEAIDAIFRTGAEFVNVRTFLPGKPDGNPFVLGRKNGLDNPVTAAIEVRKYLGQNFYVIVNEEIPVDDGGFSGVLFGDTAEFSSCDTPRCVEKPGYATLPRMTMFNLAEQVYGRRLNIPFPSDHRVEFSVHPGPVGYLRQSQVIWQVEKGDLAAIPARSAPVWPNRYSKDMGDKAYGILIASLYGIRVPRTRVFGRLIPLFEFGDATNSSQKVWVRTCPRQQQPGLYTTRHGWLDPFALMQREDPDGSGISAIIVQDSVDTAYSGAAITAADGTPLIEGTAQEGEAFMLGAVGPDANLPPHVVDAVTRQWREASEMFGPVRFEWVMDSANTLWTVQFHVGRSDTQGRTIYPGVAASWWDYNAEKGLPEFRKLVERAKRDHFGIILTGAVGITSHFGDILRRAKVPSRLDPDYRDEGF